MEIEPIQSEKILEVSQDFGLKVIKTPTGWGLVEVERPLTDGGWVVKEGRGVFVDQTILEALVDAIS